MENNNVSIRYESAFDKFVSYYESFINDILDPYRREKRGHFEDPGLIVQLEAAFGQAVAIANPLCKKKETKILDYQYLRTIGEVSKTLLGYTDRKISHYFLEGKEEAYVPDLTLLNEEISFNLRELAKETLPDSIIKVPSPRHFYNQL